MLKTYFFCLLLISIFSLRSFSQCLTSLPPPDCTGSEPLVIDNETINGGTTKWYYGSTVTFNSVTLNGGTLVVCGNLTIDKFYITTGTIFIRPGGRLVIGSGIGAGLQFQGGCAIYNYGTCEIQRNLTLENNATAASPNRVVNALSTSVFKMSNQYFVINNSHSWFVNNGSSEFWGIITDPQTSPGAVCLGSGSTTKMAILINKVANSYVSPSGNSCVYVFQYSEFYGRLTSDPTLFVCLSSGHTSNSSCIPFGCAPNNWGSAQVFTNCSGCASIAVLAMQFTSFSATPGHGVVNLQWQAGPDLRDGKFIISRSADGINFFVIDSLPVYTSITHFNSIDKNPLPGNNYYMISYTNPRTGMTASSKMVKVIAEMIVGFNLYPVPFDNKFFITCEPGTSPERILLTDIAGRNIRTSYTLHDGSPSVEVTVLDKLQSGLYIIHMQTNKNNVVAKTIFKR